MRTAVLALLALPASADAQIQAAAPATAMPATVAPPPSGEASPDNRAAPLAAGKDDRILSKNEAYNLAREAEGRVGVRLGDDLSYRVTGN